MTRREPDLTDDGLQQVLQEITSASGPASATRTFNGKLIKVFRANGGVIPGPLGGPSYRFLLLTTRGARTARVRTVPLGYVKVAGQLFILASKGGAETDPKWLANIEADPRVVVELGASSFDAVAVKLEGAEREDAFAAIAAKAPRFAEYQQRTKRQIPVVRIDRVS